MIDEAKLRVPGEFEVIGYDVPDFSGDWRAWDFGDPDDERLATLREEFALDRVIAGCDEFEALLELKQWVRSRWDHGWSASFKTVQDGLDVLRAAAAGEQFTCGFYAMVLVDCAIALGFPARRVSIGLADSAFPRDDRVGNVGHSVAEVWSNEHGAWVVLDADLNVYYEFDGWPLGALQIREAWLEGATEQLCVVQDEPRFVVPQGECLRALGELFPDYGEYDDERMRLAMARFSRHDAADYYAHVRIGGWEFVDDRCLPNFVRHFAPSPPARFTGRPADMYPTLNSVRLAAAPSWDEVGARLSMTLEHCMPWFQRYEARIDDEDWAVCEEHLEWPMRPGVNALEVRAVNRRERPGIVSRIEVAYAAAQW